LIARKRNHFDELRLLAAWFVLFSHCYPLTGQTSGDPFASFFGLETLGGVGVSIFFVLSGYLVLLSWQRADTVSDFVWKRVRRIFPALVVCIFVSVFCLGPLLTTLSLRDYFSHEQTWRYLHTATAWHVHFALPGVFGSLPNPNVVNGSLWSLPYEIQCYLVLAVVGALPMSLRWKTLLIVLVLTGVLVLRIERGAIRLHEPLLGMDYYTNKLGLHFAMGALVASWREAIFDRTRWFWFSSLALVGVFNLEPSAFREVSYVLLTSLLILAFGLHASWLPHLPQAIGDCSYGLYLWAFPVQQLFVQMKWHENLGFAWFVALSTLVSLLCAASSWYSIEKRWLIKERTTLTWLRKRS
jgi:peptidoglycan/LPS O-acetylase OafA/YrhL